MLDMT